MKEPLTQAISTYKLIRSLPPFDVYDIITRGVCPDLCINAKYQIVSMYGERYLNTWLDGTKMDLLDLYLSDSGIQIYTTKERAEELEKEFKSWNIFYEVWSKWYGGNRYIVGFNYTYDDFNSLYGEWVRNKKLESIL